MIIIEDLHRKALFLRLCEHLRWSRQATATVVLVNMGILFKHVHGSPTVVMLMLNDEL